MQTLLLLQLQFTCTGEETLPDLFRRNRVQILPEPVKASSTSKVTKSFLSIIQSSNMNGQELTNETQPAPSPFLTLSDLKITSLTKNVVKV